MSGIDAGHPEPLIRIRDLRFRYPDATGEVLSIGALDIAGAGLTALTGASGAGKSTLIEIMAGTLREPYEGSIEVFGVDLQKLQKDAERQKQLRRIGFIPQDFGLLPGISVRQVLEQDLRDAQVPRAEHEQRIDAAVAKVELTEFSGRETQQLSGGQRQRVAIARMLARDVELVIADEPTANLDQPLVDAVVDLFRELARSRPVIIVTHDPALAAKCDRTVLLPSATRSVSAAGKPRTGKRWAWVVAIALLAAVTVSAVVIVVRSSATTSNSATVLGAGSHSGTPSATVAAAPITQGEVEAILPQFFVAYCKSLPTDARDAPPCPITRRLQSYFNQTASTGVGGADEWTRSQFVWTFVSVSVEQTATGAIGHVVLSPAGTPGYSENRLDFFLVRAQGGGVLVDDTTCTGMGIATSLYTSPYGQPSPACYASVPP